MGKRKCFYIFRNLQKNEFGVYFFSPSPCRWGCPIWSSFSAKYNLGLTLQNFNGNGIFNCSRHNKCNNLAIFDFNCKMVEDEHCHWIYGCIDIENVLPTILKLGCLCGWSQYSCVILKLHIGNWIILLNHSNHGLKCYHFNTWLIFFILFRHQREIIQVCT